MRMRAHLADEKMRRVFVDGLQRRHALRHRRNLIGPCSWFWSVITGRDARRPSPPAWSAPSPTRPATPPCRQAPRPVWSPARCAPAETPRPRATGTFACPVSSSMRSVCSVSSSRQASPVTMVMPSTSTWAPAAGPASPSGPSRRGLSRPGQSAPAAFARGKGLR